MKWGLDFFLKNIYPNSWRNRPSCRLKTSVSSNSSISFAAPLFNTLLPASQYRLHLKQSFTFKSLTKLAFHPYINDNLFSSSESRYLLVEYFVILGKFLNKWKNPRWVNRLIITCQLWSLPAEVQASLLYIHNEHLRRWWPGL